MAERVNAIQAKMFDLIAQWEKSGLPKKEFCAQQQVANATFHYWFKKYKHRDVVSPAFIPVRVKDLSPTHAFAELILGDGRKIIFYNPVEASFLKALLF
jgi:hypothetical protein